MAITGRSVINNKAFFLLDPTIWGSISHFLPVYDPSMDKDAMLQKDEEESFESEFRPIDIAIDERQTLADVQGQFLLKTKNKHYTISVDKFYVPSAYAERGPGDEADVKLVDLKQRGLREYNVVKNPRYNKPELGPDIRPIDPRNGSEKFYWSKFNPTFDENARTAETPRYLIEDKEFDYDFNPLDQVFEKDPETDNYTGLVYDKSRLYDTCSYVGALDKDKDEKSPSFGKTLARGELHFTLFLEKKGESMKFNKILFFGQKCYKGNKISLADKDPYPLEFVGQIGFDKSFFVEWADDKNKNGIKQYVCKAYEIIAYIDFESAESMNATLINENDWIKTMAPGFQSEFSHAEVYQQGFNLWQNPGVFKAFYDNVGNRPSHKYQAEFTTTQSLISHFNSMSYPGDIAIGMNSLTSGVIPLAKLHITEKTLSDKFDEIQKKGYKIFLSKYPHIRLSDKYGESGADIRYADISEGYDEEERILLPRFGIMNITSSKNIDNFGFTIGEDSFATAWDIDKSLGLDEKLNGKHIAVALGRSAWAEGISSVAIGMFAKAKRNHALAIGSFSTSALKHSLAVGYNVKSDKLSASEVDFPVGWFELDEFGSYALGENAKADNGLSLGYESIANGRFLYDALLTSEKIAELKDNKLKQIIKENTETVEIDDFFAPLLDLLARQKILIWKRNADEIDTYVDEEELGYLGNGLRRFESNFSIAIGENVQAIARGMAVGFNSVAIARDAYLFGRNNSSNMAKTLLIGHGNKTVRDEEDFDKIPRTSAYQALFGFNNLLQAEADNCSKNLVGGFNNTLTNGFSNIIWGLDNILAKIAQKQKFEGVSLVGRNNTFNAYYTADDPNLFNSGIDYNPYNPYSYVKANPYDPYDPYASVSPYNPYRVSTSAFIVNQKYSSFIAAVANNASFFGFNIAALGNDLSISRESVFIGNRIKMIYPQNTHEFLYFLGSDFQISSKKIKDLIIIGKDQNHFSDYSEHINIGIKNFMAGSKSYVNSSSVDAFSSVIGFYNSVSEKNNVMGMYNYSSGKESILIGNNNYATRMSTSALDPYLQKEEFNKAAIIIGNNNNILSGSSRNASIIGNDNTVIAHSDFIDINSNQSILRSFVMNEGLNNLGHNNTLGSILFGTSGASEIISTGQIPDNNYLIFYPSLSSWLNSYNKNKFNSQVIGFKGTAIGNNLDATYSAIALGRYNRTRAEAYQQASNLGDLKFIPGVTSLMGRSNFVSLLCLGGGSGDIADKPHLGATQYKIDRTRRLNIMEIGIAAGLKKQWETAANNVLNYRGRDYAVICFPDIDVRFPTKDMLPMLPGRTIYIDINSEGEAVLKLSTLTSQAKGPNIESARDVDFNWYGGS